MATTRELAAHAAIHLATARPLVSALVRDGALKPTRLRRGEYEVVRRAD